MDVGSCSISFHKGGKEWDNHPEIRSTNEDCDMDHIQLCRLCANIIDSAAYIFHKIGNEKTLANKINICLPVTVKTTDILPKQLCTSCVTKLHQCFDFSTSCLEAEEKLKLHFQKLPNFSNTSDPSLLNSNENKNTSKLDNENYCCPLCYNGSMVILNEDYERNGEKLAENREDVLYKEQNRFSEYLLENSMLVDGYKTIEVNENSGCEIVSQENEEKEQFNEIRFFFPEVSITDTPLKSESILVQGEPATEGTFKIKEETIFICRICGDLFPTVELCYSHSVLHVDENYYPCILCDSNFTNESELENHFMHHAFEHQNKWVTDLNDESSEHQSDIHTQYFDCHECKRKFITKKRLNFHQEYHNGTRSSTLCEPCNKTFENETLLYHHTCSISDNDNNKPIYCDICGKSFHTKRALASHRRNEHAGDRPYKCEDCGRCLSSHVSLMEHIRNLHLTDTAFQCEQCGATFSRIARLQKHMRTHCETPIPQPQTCYKCSECNATFPDAAQSLQHGEIHLQFHVDPVSVFSVFKCEYCETCFINQVELRQHLKHHTGESPYVCLVCNTYYHNYYSVMEHKKIHNGKCPTSSSSNAQFSIPVQFICEFCAKCFKQWEHLYIHRHKAHLYNSRNNLQNTKDTKRHSNFVYPYRFDQSNLCERCGENFETRSELMKHCRDKHPRGSKYKCNDCGKLLANLTGLVIHRRLHTGEKPFICDVCGKGFHQSSGMYTHRRTHTKECPYRCEICGRRYNIKGDLDNHRRAKHTKERPFKCEICGKSFLTSSVYYQHKLLHTGVRKYRCSQCEKTFARWNALRLHTRTHTGEKPFTCGVCKRNFAQKGDMKKHMKSQHNMVLEK